MKSSPVRAMPGTRYLAVFSAIVVALLLAVLLINDVIDPYVSHQWDSPLLQRLRPPREKLSPWGKTYAVFKYQPQVLYVGNSRTELALAANPALFDGKRVFNAAISGASLGDAIAMLQHARSSTELDTVVWGLDYWSFLLENGNSDFDRELVAFDQHYGWRRRLLGFKRSLSFDMAFDSIDLMLGRFGEVCLSSLAFHGQRDMACSAANLKAQGGVAKAMISDIAKIKSINPKTDAAILAFQAELELLCRSHIRVMTYIHPLHAIALEHFHQRGHGSELERWKRRLVASTETARQHGCRVQLFDFSGFNSVTSETIPQVSGEAEMKNYWEASHYRAVVGQKILAKMIPLAGAALPADFGTELDHSNIETHLLQMRQEREHYRAQHGPELLLLQQWFGRSTGAESHLP
jgi:hypothetical protein